MLSKGFITELRASPQHVVGTFTLFFFFYVVYTQIPPLWFLMCEAIVAMVTKLFLRSVFEKSSVGGHGLAVASAPF